MSGEGKQGARDMKILVVGDIVGGPGRMAMARVATRYNA